MLIATVVVLLQSAQLAGGGMQSVANVLPAPRATAPLTIVNRPVIVGFRSTRVKKAQAGEKIETVLRGRFYRDDQGRTRTDYFDPAQDTESIAIQVFWYPENRRMIFVSFADRTMFTLERPIYPN